jgi:hypothetical protein
VYAVYWYGAGAAHPNGYHISFNFLLNPLVEIPTIRYLFQSPEEVLPKLAQYYSNALNGFPLEDEGLSVAVDNAQEGTADRWAQFTTFSFDNEGLRIYGEVKRFRETQFDVIPYSLLEKNMKKTITYALSIAF